MAFNVVGARWAALAGSSCLVSTGLLLAGCSADPAATRVPADGGDAGAETSCGSATLAERFVAGWATPPAPPAPGLAAYAIAAPDQIDLAPYARGLHPGLVLTEGPNCTVRATATQALATASSSEAGATPAAPGDALPPLGAASDDPQLRALIVTSFTAAADPATATDIGAWDHLLAALGSRGRLLAAPTAEALDAALEAACSSVAPDTGTLLLATLGPGAPDDGGDQAGFRLGRGQIAWRVLATHLRASCGHVRQVIWIADSSFAQALRPTVAAPPIIVLAASDQLAADAPRVSLRGPGALTAALLARIPPAYADSCPGPTRDAGALAKLFTSPDRSLHDTMIALRWAAIGAPALASLPVPPDPGPASTPAHPADAAGPQALIADALGRGVPNDIVHIYGLAPTPARCARGLDCACEAGPCQRFQCDAGLCHEVPDVGARCDDQNACTTDDHCDAIARCTGEGRACDDHNACTRDDCDPAIGCTTEPTSEVACNDNDDCTTMDVCLPDGSCQGTALDCDDGDPCTRDSCDPLLAGPLEANPRAPCVATRGNFPCDDHDACTTGDQCHAGACVGVRAACDDDNPCTADGCDPATGACLATPLPDGATCDDGDACTSLDRCRAHHCQGVAEACDDGLACTFDRCTAGACEHLPAPGTCLGTRGCIAVGTHPDDAPCMVCAATDRLVADPALAGQSCPDDGLACTADTCQDGLCRHRDAPEACHVVGPDGDARCVGLGEPLTECLVCAGGGVAVPAAIGASCGGPESCALGACDGNGGCALFAPIPPRTDGACCAPEALTCGATYRLDAASVRNLAPRIAAWSCSDDPTPGPERHLAIRAACTGRLVVELAGPPGALLIGGVASCPATTCAEADPARLSADLAADATFDVAIELPAGLERGVGADRFWIVTTRCECAADAVP